MKVLQIYTHIPEELQGCIDSVKAYADRVGAEYIAVTEGWDGKGVAEAWSNLVRMQFAAKHTDLLYLDWDYLLADSFEIEGSKALFGGMMDSAFWTGDDTTPFQLWLDALTLYNKEGPTACHERARLYKIMKNHPITENRLDKSTYQHLLHHRIRRRQNVTNDR